MAAMDTSPDGISVARTSLNSCGTTTRGTGRRKRVRAKSHGVIRRRIVIELEPCCKDGSLISQWAWAQ